MALDCAICREPTRPMLNFGMMPLANGYAEPDRREPLAIHWCPECGLYQLAQTVPSETLFSDYAYRTGATKQHAHWNLLHATWRARVPAGADFVVDIGGNDGSALLPFQGARHRINIDPFAPEQAEDITAIREPWDARVAVRLVDQHGYAKLIMASNVWAHIPDLHMSATAASILLDPDGWLVVQAPWCRDFWRYQLYDTAYHEHVYYLGVQAMRTLFQRHGMDVHDVEYLPNVHGGSLRYWIRHGNDGVADSVQRFEDMEADSAAVRGDLEQFRYKQWQQRQRDYWDTLQNPLWGITAPAKATMYLVMTGLSTRLTRIFDDTQAKQGRRLPGTDLVVEPLRNIPQDDRAATAVAFAWNHQATLRKRLWELGFSGRVVMPHA